MESLKYQVLGQEAADVKDVEGHERQLPWSKRIKPERVFTLYTLSILLGISVACNIFLLGTVRTIEAKVDSQSYVGLQKNIPTPIVHDHRDLEDPLWDDPEFDSFVGTVALTDKFVEQKGLLPAQRFPWDASKGIYVIHGFHSLHCVFVLRDAIMEYRSGANQTWQISHVTHCLHVLREDTICNADDLPRYTGRINAEAGNRIVSSGTGEIRMCRDWNQLREFALHNSACYRRPADHPIPLLDRYKFCPDGSKPWEDMDG